MIWAPDQEFAEEVIEECAAFPFGDHDDLVDSTTQAIMRLRQGGFVLHPDDEKDERRRFYDLTLSGREVLARETTTLERIVDYARLRRIV